ncbi:MAG TPA: hypothetical protein VMV03_04500 [Spirochaetia bacterium]|nr:hypothetical protein [Spirochaetia bacterium]
MDWRVRMKRDELELKRLVRRLAVMRGDGAEERARREQAVRVLRAKVSDMRTFLEDCLSGRTAYEQSMMEYRVRVEFPLYSHLGTLSAVAPDFVDWFCA